MGLTYKHKFNKKYGFQKDVSHSIKEISKLSGIKYTNALKIVKKGEGAYFSNPQSVRPMVKSETQWGIARLYSAVMGGKASAVDKDLLKKDRDYKKEYKDFQVSEKQKKYRSELNKYNKKKGTYGNGDKLDASHKNGKIVGFEKQSTNRARK